MADTNQRKVWSMGNNESERKIEKSGGGIVACPLFTLPFNLFICLLSIMLLHSPTMAWADEYVPIMSKEDNVCQHMLSLYNADLRRYGEVKYKQHKEFNWIKWKEKKIKLKPAGAPEEVVDVDAKIAVFDINNDSKDEAIIYHESMLFNRPMDVYDIFKTGDLVMLDNIVDGKTYYSKSQKSFDSHFGPTH